MIKGDFMIRTQHFPLSSHRALGPVPTKVREMLWAFLTGSIEYWILTGEGKLVILARWWILHVFFPTSFYLPNITLTFFLLFNRCISACHLESFILLKHKNYLIIPYFIRGPRLNCWAPHLFSTFLLIS